MNNWLKILIRSKTSYEKLISLVFFIITFEGVCSVFIPQIHFICYFVDIIVALLMVAILVRKKISFIFSTSLNLFKFCFLIFLLTGIISTILNFDNLLLHLWGFRSVYTNFCFFVACVTFEKSDDLRIIDALFKVNLISSFIEIILGYRQDSLGGIYGVAQGQVNGPLNILLVIITTKLIIEYINKKLPIKKFIFIGGLLLIIAAFAELKVFFVEIVLISVMCYLITDFSFRKVKMIFVGVFGAVFGVYVLTIVFPEFNMQMFSVSYIIRYLTNPGGYVGQFANDAGDINRLAFWDVCTSLLGDKLKLFLGMGLGNCDQIGMLDIQSEFYNRYNSLHYYMFPLPMILLQQGVVGIILYISLFVSILIAVIKQKKSNIRADKSICEIVEVLCILSFVIIIYDTSLMGKGGLLFFYVLAMPFIRPKLKKGIYDT